MNTESGTFLFINGKIYDSETQSFKDNDVVVEDSKILKIGKIDPTSYKGKSIDLEGKYVCPGFIDMHVHLREPGREDEETVKTGAEAAMAGGFTAVCCMPNTSPVIDTRGVVEFIKKQANGLLVDVYPIGAVTKGREGNELTEMGDMVDAGAIAFSDDGSPIANAEIMRYALEYSKMFNVPIIDHCEDPYLANDKKMNEGEVSTSLGIPAVPSVAEDLLVARDLMLAEFTGGNLHIAHISSGHSVDLVRDAKKKGIPVSAEACPHHFTLTDDAIRSFDTNLRVNPPIRTQRDVDTIIKGIKDNTIEAIATDHAPHSIEEKDVEFDQAPPGMIGLETAIGLVITFLVKKDHLSLEDMVERMAIAPRKILNLKIPEIKVGEIANFSIVDPDIEWTVDKTKFRSRSSNSPFVGWKLVGKSFGVFNNGQWYQNIND